jgi:hypothetical protein
MRRLPSAAVHLQRLVMLTTLVVVSSAAGTESSTQTPSNSVGSLVEEVETYLADKAVAGEVRWPPAGQTAAGASAAGLVLGGFHPPPRVALPPASPLPPMSSPPPSAKVVAQQRRRLELIAGIGLGAPVLLFTLWMALQSDRRRASARWRSAIEREEYRRFLLANANCAATAAVTAAAADVDGCSA